METLRIKPMWGVGQQGNHHKKKTCTHTCAHVHTYAPMMLLYEYLALFLRLLWCLQLWLLWQLLQRRLKALLSWLRAGPHPLPRLHWRCRSGLAALHETKQKG